MLRLSIQARQTLAKLSLPLFLALSVGVMLVGRADGQAAARARMWLADRLSPLYATVAAPAAIIRRMADDLLGVADLAAENRTLRAENARLHRWYEVALALAAENATLKENLHWIPEPAPAYVTGRVVADAGGIYDRAVLLYIGPTDAVRKGQVALDASGLIGRVTEIGRRSARVLLITDANSRIPVELPRAHLSAIMAGTNGPRPRLIYLPDGARVVEGERVVTSSEANVFPAGLPVGTVHVDADGQISVAPGAALQQLTIVRLFDYKLQAVSPPPALGHGLATVPGHGVPTARPDTASPDTTAPE